MSPGDALKLLEYEDIDYFIEQYSKIKKRKDIIDRMTNIEDVRLAHQSMSSKVGYQKYKKWRLDQQDILREPPKKKDNLFSKLKAAARNKTKQKTIFDQLKKGRK